MKWIRSLTFILAVLFICRVCVPVALAEDDSSLPDISGDSISVLMPDTDNEADSETDELVPDTGADGGSDDGGLLTPDTGADSDSDEDSLLTPDTGADSDSDEDSLLTPDTDVESGLDEDGLLIPDTDAAGDSSEDSLLVPDTDAGGSSDDGLLSPDTDEDSGSGAPSGIEYAPVPVDFDYTDSVISFTVPDELGSTFDMDCGDSDFVQLHSSLDSVTIYSTVEKDGLLYSLPLSIEWDFTTVEAETPGGYTALGNIPVPEGAALADGSENAVFISVQVTAVLTHFDEPDRTDAVAFALGTSQEELSDWFADYYGGFTGYDAQGNYYYLMTGTWSLENVDTGTPDVYYASAAPDLGDGYVLGDGVSLPHQLCAVSIQTPGEPDINCCVSARGFLRFPWILSTEQQEQLEQFTVWIQQDGGAWTQLSEGFYFTSDDLQLSQRIFEYESSYGLRVSYPGGQTGVLTFQYDGELLIVDYAGGDRDGGDVDGSGPLTGSQPAPTPAPTSSNSDHNDDEPTGDTPSSVPDITLLESSPTSYEAPVILNPEADEPQSEPIIAAPSAITKLVPVLGAAFAFQTNTAAAAQIAETHGTSQKQDIPETVNHVQKAAPVQTKVDAITSKNAAAVHEFYSPTQTVISGLRLRDLCAGEKSVVFGKGNLTVSIPSELLLALNLADMETLSVKLTQLEKDQVMLAVDASGKAITELPGTVLRLRYAPRSENAEITVWNEAGEKTAGAEFDGEFLRFTVETAGVYTISEAMPVPKKAQSAQGGASPLLPLMGGGLLLAAGGGTVLFRRYHG